MTREKAEATAQVYNQTPGVLGTTAVVGEFINIKTYKIDYTVIYITDTAVEGYNASNLEQKAKYGESFYYALNQAKQSGNFVTEFNNKLTELLG
jgi:hypothetical protein